MEIVTKKSTNILKHLKCVEKPQLAKYLTHDRAIIKNENAWYFVDPTKDTNIKQINDYHLFTSQLALDSHNKQFAIHNDSIINIYDVAGNQKHEKIVYGQGTGIYSATFANDTTIFLSEYTGITRWNYTNEYSITELHDRDKRRTIFYHPRTPLIWFTHENSDIALINKDTLLQEHYYKNDDHSPYNYYGENASLMHNPDNVIIPYFNYDRLFTINIDDAGKRIQFPTEKKHDIVALVSHPNNKVFITLSSKKSKKHPILSYWDISTQKLILTTKISHLKNTTTYSPESSSLSISPDKKQLMVTAEDDCIIVEIPDTIQ